MTSGFKANLYVDYIYLDTEERKRFAQMSHEYLIDQLQIQGKDTITSFNHRMRLNFNHPVKELIWVLEAPESTEENAGTGALNTANFALFDGVRSTGKTIVWAAGAQATTKPVSASANVLTTDGAGTLSQFQITTAGDGYKKGDVLEIDTASAGANAAEIVLKARHIARNPCYNGYVKKAGSSSVGVVTDFGIFGEGDKDEKYDWMKDAKLQINGHDRFSARPASYFRRVQPYQFHSGAPEVPVYCYSFALRPEEFQPSGTCNFSRIDNAYLDINLNEYLTPHIYGSDGASAQVPYYSTVPASFYSAGHVYTKPTFDAANCEVNMFAFAVSYNELKIVSGRGGLAYSN